MMITFCLFVVVVDVNVFNVWCYIMYNGCDRKKNDGAITEDKMKQLSLACN